MGKAVCEASRAARAVFERADDALGFSLSRLCLEGPESELALTANTQPAILTTSVATLAALREVHDLVPSVALGHSLGEFSALVAVGALDFDDAVRLVRLRGLAMQEAVAPGVGAMVALIGVSSEDAEILCTQSSTEYEVVSPANENGGGQVVVAGHAPAVGRLVELAKGRRIRAIPLKVSAPFHCALMRPAAERLREALKSVEIRPLLAPVIANVDAQPNADSSRVKELLVAQVTGRVRWEASVNAAIGLGIDLGLEVGHGSVLAGLIKRIAPSLRVHSVGSPADFNVLKDGAT
jgi:[acyl-carrier-protein] S-malonyltransferase